MPEPEISASAMARVRPEPDADRVSPPPALDEVLCLLSKAQASLDELFTLLAKARPIVSDYAVMRNGPKDVGELLCRIDAALKPKYARPSLLERPHF